ncbi:MAG: hypothetical protein ACRDX8_14760, partial [Acidimicrobiales bacterium]
MIRTPLIALLPLSIAVVSAIPSATPAASVQSSGSINVGEGQFPGSIGFAINGSTPGSATATAPTTTPTTPTPAAQQVVTDPSPLTSPSQITSCYQGVYTYVDSAGQTVMGFAGSFSCPKVPIPTPSKPSPSPATPAPGAVAATVWEQDGANQLPSPHPYIAPGYALAGLRGYLE